MKKLFRCFKVPSRTEQKCFRRSAEDVNSGSGLLGGIYSSFSRRRRFLKRSPVGCASAGRRMRKRDAKYGPLGRSALHDDFTPVILNDLLHHCQAETGAVLFSLTDEGFKQRVPDGPGDAAPVVADLGLTFAASSLQLDLHV